MPQVFGFRWGWIAVAVATGALSARANDSPTWGYGPDRNQVSVETGILPELQQGVVFEGSVRALSSLRWTTSLGSRTYGNPVVAGGRIYVGTNNGQPRDPRYSGNRAALLCFRESDGDFLWQLNLEHIRSNDVSICSPPFVEGDRVYLVTNRSEVVCLDAKGMSDGNDGPFVDEASFSHWPRAESVPVGEGDADILWQYRISDELTISIHGTSAGSPLVVGDLLYVNTSNGIDAGHLQMSEPDAPLLLALDKNTGVVRGMEQSGISSRTLHGNWSSPALGRVGDEAMVIFGGGDGWCYGFDPNPTVDESGLGILRELWRFDCNPHDYRFNEEGQPRRPRTSKGPNEVIATPVFHEGRVFVSVGRDLQAGSGRGAFSCYDVSGRGDISRSGLVWRNEDVGRSVSTAAVSDGLCFVGDFYGMLYCVDAKTGETLWVHDTGAGIVASPLVVDGKVMIADSDGILHVLAFGRTLTVLAKIDFGGRMFMTPVAANGRLYVSTQSKLYALGPKEIE